MSRKNKRKIENNTQTTKDAFNYSEQANDIIQEYERSQRPQNRFNNFKLPTKNDSLNIAKDSEMTSDSMPINNFDFNSFEKINKTLINSWFLGYQEYSILSQNGLIQNIIQTYAQECVREWIEINSVSTSGNKDKKDKINKLNAAFEKFNVRTHIKNAVELMIGMGGCKIYPKIRGDDSTEGGVELELPFFSKEKMGKGDLLYFKVIEPLYAVPTIFNATNPLADDFYVPSMWNVLGKQINSSRLLHFSYNYVPTLLKPVYYFNGMPLVQLCLEYLMGFESVRQNIVGISGRYNVNIFKTNMNALLNYKSGSTFQNGQDPLTRLKLAQALMTNFSIFALSNDKESPEEWQQFNMAIAGLDAILSQNAELICACTRTPAIKLFGTSPKGFNSTGDTEVRIFYDLIKSFQMSNIMPNLQKMFELIQINEFGEIDDDLIICFKPLWSESSTEKSKIQVDKMSINIAYQEKGILSTREIRDSLNKDQDSGYSDLTEYVDEDENEYEDENDNEEEILWKDK